MITYNFVVNLYFIQKPRSRVKKYKLFMLNKINIHKLLLYLFIYHTQGRTQLFRAPFFLGLGLICKRKNCLIINEN